MSLTYKSSPIKQAASLKPLFLYLLKFGAAFCLFYFGTLAVIGLSSPDNSYSPFVAKYLNFIDPLRFSLLYGAKMLLSIFNYTTAFVDSYTLALKDGNGVRMVYSCVGYGVMSFWAAFIIANRGKWTKKLAWVLCGWIALWLINVLRVALLILAGNKNWTIPLGWDHHTWFNIVAYALIFALIYFYDRSFRKNKKTNSNTANQYLQTIS